MKDVIIKNGKAYHHTTSYLRNRMEGHFLDWANQPRVYKTYPDFPDLIRWFELVHIEKHLMRLKSMGKVRQEENKWIRA